MDKEKCEVCGNDTGNYYRQYCLGCQLHSVVGPVIKEKHVCAGCGHGRKTEWIPAYRISPCPVCQSVRKVIVNNKPAAISGVNN